MPHESFLLTVLSPAMAEVGYAILGLFLLWVRKGRSYCVILSLTPDLRVSSARP